MDKYKSILDSKNRTQDPYSTRELTRVNINEKTSYNEQITLFLRLQGGIKFQDIKIPIDIFNNQELSGLETITKYLKENKNMCFKEISLLLNRNQKTIWGAYNSSKKKMNESFDLNKQEKQDPADSIFIPAQIFMDRSLSFLEVLTKYLKENLNMRYCKIAGFLNRDDRTIWTVYQRMKKKHKMYYMAYER